MKGYRTIVFSAFMTLIGLVGVKISPATATNWADIFVTVWGIGAILLRQITTTPVGSLSTVLASVASQEIEHLKPADIAGLQADVQNLLSHFGITLQAAAVTANMAQKLDTVASTVDSIAAATNPAATAGPPVVAAAVSALVDDGPLSPSLPASAQPSVASAMEKFAVAAATPTNIEAIISKVI